MEEIRANATFERLSPKWLFKGEVGSHQEPKEPNPVQLPTNRMSFQLSGQRPRVEPSHSLTLERCQQGRLAPWAVISTNQVKDIDTKMVHLISEQRHIN